jgi:hypothetical protein
VTTPHVLADPDGNHLLSGQYSKPATPAERESLAAADLGDYVDDENVVAAFRAGWDVGVSDLADALTKDLS